MRTRRILKIVLAVVSLAVCLVAGLIVYELLNPVSRLKVDQSEVAKEGADGDSRRSPWASKHDEAIKTSRQLLDNQILRRLESEAFLENELSLKGVESAGWRAKWWGETKYGPSYYLLKYSFYDGPVELGPEWVVDLQSEEIEPKNALARRIEAPGGRRVVAEPSDIIQRITGHQLNDSLHLGGALMIRWAELQSEKSETDIQLQGWRIEHNYGDRFNCYFLWEEGNDAKNAYFEYDQSEGAIRPGNLQAYHVMQIGERFAGNQKVNIEPETFDRRYDSPTQQWRGKSRDKCVTSRGRLHPACRALSSVLAKRILIENIEWYLSFRFSEPGVFETCRRQNACRWKPERLEDEQYSVRYEYRVGQDENELHWHIDLSNNDLRGEDKITRAALRVTELRSKSLSE